jgi:hypothetical protein
MPKRQRNRTTRATRRAAAQQRAEEEAQQVANATAAAAATADPAAITTIAPAGAEAPLDQPGQAQEQPTSAAQGAPKTKKPLTPHQKRRRAEMKSDRDVKRKVRRMKDKVDRAIGSMLTERAKNAEMMEAMRKEMASLVYAAAYIKGAVPVFEKMQADVKGLQDDMGSVKECPGDLQPRVGKLEVFEERLSKLEKKMEERAGENESSDKMEIEHDM